MADEDEWDDIEMEEKHQLTDDEQDLEVGTVMFFFLWFNVQITKKIELVLFHLIVAFGSKTTNRKKLFLCYFFCAVSILFLFSNVEKARIKQVMTASCI